MEESTQENNGDSERVDDVYNIFELFRKRGDSMYAGEPVSQTEHALQAAFLAENEEAGHALITAALLHDIGHLLSTHPEDCAESGIDDNHESMGAKWLSARFGPEVCEPVRLHVPAKRYLCSTDPTYLQNVSRASLLSLELQGGPFTSEEVKAFEDVPFSQEAIRLRHWDDAAKIKSLNVPDLHHFRKYLEESLKL